MNTSTKTALTILKKCLEDERINITNNEKLYDDYRYDTNVSNEIEEMLEIFDLEIFDNANNGLFITAGVDNTIFGYSNADLKSILSIKNNTELSICLYLMYCILARFYKESSLIATAEFITQAQLIEDAEIKILAVKTMLEGRAKEDESRNKDQEDTSFAKIIKVWGSLSHTNVSSTAKNISKDERSNVKIAFANKALKFFCANDLLIYNEVQNIYMVRPKLSIVVGYYYDEFKSRNEITEFLEALRDENIGEEK